MFPDEAYYWEWSRHLAAGYYDHPPMIAWLIRLGTSVAGVTPLGVRLVPVLAGVLAGLFACATARRLGGNRAALITAIIVAAIPLSGAGLVLATPDAPLLAAGAATIYALVRALQSPARSRESLRWWCVAGWALGLAFTSKITAALLPLGVLVGFLTRRDLRQRFTEPGPYVATLIALVVFLPVIFWNAQHEWIAYAFQLRHGLSTTSGSAIGRELEMIAGQAAVVSPIVFALCAIAVTRALRSAEEGRGLHRVLAVVSLVIVAFFMYSATRRRVEPNWPALAYVPAVLLVATQAGGRVWDRWLRAGIGLAAAITLVGYVNAFVPVLPVPAPRDPAARAAGWGDLAAAVERVARSHSPYSANSPDSALHATRRPISAYRTHIAGNRYQEASALAFNLPDHPETYSLNLSGRANQYDLWPTFRERALSGDALILVVDDVVGASPTVDALTPHFNRISRGRNVLLARRGSVIKNLRIWILDDWRGTWPSRELRSRP